MFIRNLDIGLERLVRERLPLPEDVGDVTFEAPTSNWSAQLSRITVSFFLYDVQRSTQPSRSSVTRTPGEGVQRRLPQPMVQLTYLVSAWAGSAQDEHQLLGDLISMFAGLEIVPAEMFPNEMSTSVHVSIGDDRSMGRELWGSIGGSLKGALQLQVNLGADTFDWEAQAPRVERIVAMADRMDRGAQPTP